MIDYPVLPTQQWTTFTFTTYLCVETYPAVALSLHKPFSFSIYISYLHRNHLPILLHFLHSHHPPFSV